MELLEKIVEAQTEDEIKEIINKEVEEKEKNATKVEKLGMINGIEGSKPFEGFIPFDTRIKYNSLSIEDYSMNTTDFFEEFALFLKKNKISKKGMMVASLETFINGYFGLGKKNSREEVFNSNAWNTTETDEDYFKALENNNIGLLKGGYAAECTERAALAQQVLALFGMETYYCIGCVKTERKEEAHAFNVIKSKDGYVLVDYSMPVTCFDNNAKPKILFPFMGEMTNEEFEEFRNGGVLKEFNDYEFVNINNKGSNGKKRTYVVNEYTITKQNEDIR